MTIEEAYRLAMRACKETWNEKTCKQIKDVLEQQPCYVSKLTQKAYEDGKKDGYVQAKAEQQPCEDCISRHVVKDIICSGVSIDTDADKEYVCELINKLPSVTPKEKTGKWINDWEMGMSECSECGETYLWEDYKGTENFHFCPNCGCQMRGDSNGNE